MDSMRTRGTLLATIAAVAALTLSGCTQEEPDPFETLDPDTVANMNDDALDCLDGDMGACNRLRAMAIAWAPGTPYERIGATCGETLDEWLPEGEYCEVP